MQNFCTDQHFVVSYPHGAAGKFFLTTLTLFDALAYWDQDVQHNRKDYMSWFESCWPVVTQTWVKYEPNQPWGLNFYSRTYNRNNDLSCEQYNAEVIVNASNYFFECWNQGLGIIDHFHKRSVPAFYNQARRIEILVTDECMPAYKKMVSEKVWAWDETSKSGISLLDLPELSHNDINKQHRLKFNNPTRVYGYNSFDELFENHIRKLPSIQPFINAAIDPTALFSFVLSDVTKQDRYIAALEKFEHYFGQKLNRDQLVTMHTLWSQRSRLV